MVSSRSDIHEISMFSDNPLVVVWWGDYLRSDDLPYKGHYWRLSYADMRQKVSNQHHSGGDNHLQSLHHIFPVSNDLPMPSNILLLDAVSLHDTRYAARRRSLMYLKRDHCRLNIRTWSPERSRRLDARHPTNLHCVELEYESSNQDLRRSYPSSWSCVRLSFPMYALNTKRYSGSTATVIRIPFIWQIGSGDDFLFKNTDVSIWSTVEPGMGITASSMACLRPLFQVFLSRSRLLNSSSPCVSAWKLPRVGYVHSKNTDGTEEFHLQDNIPKAFRGSPSPVDNDMEAGRGIVQASNASTKALTQENGLDMT